MAHPRPGDTVKVHYTACLDDGRVFDSSKERNPLALTVGAREKPFPGLDEVLTQMEAGQERTVTIPLHVPTARTAPSSCWRYRTLPTHTCCAVMKRPRRAERVIT